MAHSGRVTDLIMHYYLEHGRNRDLEKYLRFRRMSCATRSSSDGSLPAMDELLRRTHSDERFGAVGKSMENLATLRRKAEEQQRTEGEKALLNASGGSGKSADRASDRKTPEAPAKAEGVVVKEKRVEKKSGKNFNFNLESVIEINLPPAQVTTAAIAPIALPAPVPAVESKEIPRIVLHECSTQTAATVDDDPIRPVLKTLAPVNNEETLDSTKDISAESSIASNKQRLEWDSLGDIGYDSNERLQLCGASDLNETEKNCLRRYFARKGLNFDQSVVVVRNVDKSGRSQKLYRQYMDKYHPAEESIVLPNPEAHSTPKVPPQISGMEMKSTQTSLIKPTPSRPSPPFEPSVLEERKNEDKTTGTESLTRMSAEVAESFEFFAPSVPETSGSNATSDVVSASTPATDTSASTSRSSTSAGGQRKQRQHTFDDEVQLGFTLCKSINELSSMPTGVKESLVDKIFRKLTRHDPHKRTREQLLQDYAHLRRGKGRHTGTSSVYEEADSSQSKAGSSGVVPEQEQEHDRSVGTELVIEETKETLTSPGSEKVATSDAEIVATVQAPSSDGNEARNSDRKASSREFSSGTSHRSAVSSQQEPRWDAATKVMSKNVVQHDQRTRKAMKEFLKPMTHSEVDYQNLKELQRQRKLLETEPQMTAIDREIDQLLLKKMMLLQQVQIAEKLVKEQKENLYENGALQPEGSDKSGTMYTSVHEETPISSNGSAWNSHYNMKKMIKNRSKLETPSGASSSDEMSIATFVKQKKDEFLKNYEKQRQRKVFEEQNHIYTRPYSGRQSDRLESAVLDHNMHLKKPYNSQKIGKPIKAMPASVTVTRNETPTTATSNDVFISSNSISIPAANTLTNTTTHQYDIKSSRSSPLISGRTAGTQTTGSIMRTKPIFETKPKTTATATVQVPSSISLAPVGRSCCSCNCACKKPSEVSAAPVRHTEIVHDRTGDNRRDKQAQTKPNAIAYMITFEGTGRGGPPSRTRSADNSTPSTGSESALVSDSEKDDGGTEKLISLNEHFRRSCPATLSRIDERRRCINELNKLRSRRNQQRRKLLLLTSDDSLRRTEGAKADSQLPQPLAQKRIFPSTRAIRDYTRRQVHNLPEVQRKREVERINNLRRKNRILKDVFNKNLQRKVLRGQVDLSNSVRVIRD